MSSKGPGSVRKELEQQAALLQWIKTFRGAPRVESLKDLNDGIKLWGVLQDIDHDYFGRNLPHPDADNKSARYLNIKQVHRDAAAFIESRVTESVVKINPDYQKIAAATPEMPTELSKILKLVFVAAAFSAPDKYGPIVLTLDEQSQKCMFEIIQEMQVDYEDNENETLPHGGESTGKASKHALSRDQALEFEEKMGKISHENNELKSLNQNLRKEAKRLQESLEQLQIDNENLQDRLRQTEDNLLDATSTGKGAAGTRIRALEAQIKTQEDTLDAKTSELAEASSRNTAAQKTIESLRRSTSEFQKLQDEFDVIKSERDSLAKKANTADHYREKVRALQHLEVEVKDLRTENSSLSQRSQSLDEARMQLSGQQKTIAELKKVLSSVEQISHDVEESKRRTEVELTFAKDRCVTLEDQHSKDQDTILELRDRLNGSDSGTLVNTSDLNSELDINAKSRSDLMADISQLRVENQKLKEDDGTRAENIMLKDKLEDAERKIKSSEHRYWGLQQEKLFLEAQLKNVTAGLIGDESEAYALMSERYNSAQNDLLEAKETNRKLHIDYEDKMQELDMAKLELGLNGKSEEEQRKILARAGSFEVQELRNTNKNLQEQHTTLEKEARQYQTLLTASLLEKDDLRKQLSELKDITYENDKDIDDDEQTKAILKASKDGREEGAASVLEDHTEQLQTKLVQSRDKLAKRTEHIKKQNVTISELQEKLKLIEVGDREAMSRAKEKQMAEQTTTDQEEVASLNREIALMTTAWYDLTSRLQMNNVVLQRRNDAPRSWLNKQRHLINTTTLLKGR